MTAPAGRARPPLPARTRRRTGLFLVCALAAHLACGGWSLPRGRLPAALPDDEFWRLSGEFSEQAGSFWPSDNLVSNELRFAHAVSRLRTTGGAYVGVGPEQNFSYIARLRPDVAFVVDIREENRRLHLLYKALFEVSGDRVAFVSRLFSRPPPSGLDRDAGARDIFTSYNGVAPSPALYAETVRLVGERLESRGWRPSPEDAAGVAEILRSFYERGPDIHYERDDPGHAPDPTYRQLMSAQDIWGRDGSYLASEARFAVVKDLQSRNLIVPVVGDFGGALALRQIANWLAAREVPLAAFYASNVEAYLHSRQMASYCANLASFRHSPRSAYLDSRGVRAFPARLEQCRSGGR